MMHGKLWETAGSATRVSLLGGFELTVDGERREVAGTWLPALICRLAYDDAPLSRDGLAVLLWPESAPASARHSLRQALGALRQLLPQATIGLTVTPREAALETYGGLIDVREFRTLAASPDPDDWARAMALYRGRLLHGVDVRSDGFATWLARGRGELARTAARLCQALAEHHRDEAGQHLRWMRRLRTLDPEVSPGDGAGLPAGLRR